MVDILIIGAGAAGMTAALYGLRGGKTVLLLEPNNIGGQIAFSPRVENIPSIKQISGSEFSDRLFEQVSDLGAQIELEKVTQIVKEQDHFVVTTDYNTYEAKSVIIAAGVKHRRLKIAKEESLIGKGVSYCAVCDGAFYAGQEVALVGDGNTALQYSLLLSNYCAKVHVLTLFDKFFGDDSLVKKLLARDNVEVTHNVSVFDYVGDKKLEGLKIRRTTDNSEYELKVPAVFVAIGQIPDNKVFADLAELDKEGYIIADEDCRTKTEGLFVAGDCRTKKVRQLTTAVADGAVAGVNATAYVDMG